MQTGSKMPHPWFEAITGYLKTKQDRTRKENNVLEGNIYKQVQNLEGDLQTARKRDCKKIVEKAACLHLPMASDACISIVFFFS